MEREGSTLLRTSVPHGSTPKGTRRSRGSVVLPASISVRKGTSVNKGNIESAVSLKTKSQARDQAYNCPRPELAGDLAEPRGLQVAEFGKHQGVGRHVMPSRRKQLLVKTL